MLSNSSLHHVDGFLQAHAPHVGDLLAARLLLIQGDEAGHHPPVLRLPLPHTDVVGRTRRHLRVNDNLQQSLEEGESRYIHWAKCITQISLVNLS